MSVEDCLAHKWLADECPERPLSLEAAVDQPLAENHAEDDETPVPTNAPVPELQDSPMKPRMDDMDEDEPCSLQSFSDDQSEEGASNSSDKENSLVFNQVVHSSHNISMNSSTSSSSSSNSNSSSSSSGSSVTSHSSQEVLFPDAPTTPKVLRKAPSETSPSVKALVKKFQVEKQQQQSRVSTAAASPTPIPAPQSACFVSQIPKLVNSPKSSYATCRYVSPRTSLSPSSARTPSSSVASNSSPLSMRMSKAQNGSNVSISNLDSSPKTSGKTTLSSMGSPLQSAEKSPSARYVAASQVMACVICGEFVCRHQTTVPRKSLLGMEQRITC